MSVFDDLQQLVGTPYNRGMYNSDLIDMLVLRRAKDKGFRLPTAVDLDIWNFFGAYVFLPRAGINRNVMYLDLASLYPNLMRALNVGPTTIIGSESELEESEYTVDDCYWSWVDYREVKHLEDGESYRDFTDGTYKTVYDPDASGSKTKWKDEPTLDRCYFLKPSIKEGFLKEIIEELIDLKYQYEGSMYEAVKRVVNSVYGWCSPQNQSNSSRLADWRIGESITMAGRKIIQYTAKTAVEMLDKRTDGEVYIAIGDSVPAEEPVLIKDEDGDINVTQIQNLEGRENDIEVWSEDGFTKVRRVIKKPNRKQMYMARTKGGTVHVTEDHSLVRSDGTEVKPQNVEEGEELLHSDLKEVGVQSDERVMENGIPWMLGLFAAEGHANKTYRSNGQPRFSWTISNQDRELLELAGEILSDRWNVETVIDDVNESTGCYKLALRGNENGDVKWIASDFQRMCYDGDEKKVPKEILNASLEEQREFLLGYHAGDGHIRKKSDYLQSKDFDEMHTRDAPLATGLAMMLRNQGWEYTVDRRVNYGNEYYRLRTVEFHRGSKEAVKNVEKMDYDGDYVYDLETENHHFHAGAGSIVVHNTDGCGLCWPSAPSREVMSNHVEDIVDFCNGEGYDQFMADEFGITETDHYQELENESYAPSLFVPEDTDATDEMTDEHLLYSNSDSRDVAIGTKKRYAQWITIDEGEEVDKVKIKGMEAVRSDVADVTVDGQKQILEWLLKKDFNAAMKEIAPFLREKYEAIEDEEYPIAEIAKRGGISKSIDEYGSVDRTPQPIYKGAKFADKFIDGETIRDGSKPMTFYVDSVGSQLPSTYDAETAEDGDVVDTISVEDPSNLPSGVTIDFNKHLEKSLIDPIEPILETVGSDWDEVIYEHQQSGLEAF